MVCIITNRIVGNNIREIIYIKNDPKGSLFILAEPAV